ncbi:hypothetical protein CVT26_000043 [Gymnopilus dilepis]|uniref:Uncharacterized protein n=1 Tax=Gymnopilus dilepis TaxID=231916 RepID=A0A409VGD6_9AGAR|nr:hypothetical protein CVT26_000043 [Gymnopilus dilepis]
MPRQGLLRLVCNSLKAPASFHLSPSSFTSTISRTTGFAPRRNLSIGTGSSSDLFEYTSGRWIYNDCLRRAERRLVFDVEGLSQLAAESVGRSPADVVKISKLAEGGANRIFLITLQDDFQMIARIPYPVTIPKYYAVASEVATMESLRSSGLPVPEVYGYSPTPDNAAKTEYIFMEFMKGVKLSDVWMELGEPDVASVLSQVVQLETKMMSLSFPAGGSIYYSHDLEKMPGVLTIPLKDERFCVGPDTRLPMWFGRRSQLDIDRGPYRNPQEVLSAAAVKEVAYLEKFGRPLLPFNRWRRFAYQFQPQSPSAHIDNLRRYLLMAPSIVPKDPALNRFCLRHPDLQQSNIIVHWSPDSGWQVVSLLDWQHASVLPLFLVAGVPQRLQNYNDPVSQSMTPPSLPENIDELEEDDRAAAMDVHHRRLAYYHYVWNTAHYNEPHYNAAIDPTRVLRRRLFNHAGYPWEGETLELKVALIEATQRWAELTDGGSSCPVVFDSDDVRETMDVNEVQAQMDSTFELWQDMVGAGPEGWVHTEHYEAAVARCKQVKEDVLAKCTSDEERAEILEHWPWDDMDEGDYS